MKKVFNMPVFCFFFSILTGIIYFLKLGISEQFFEFSIIQIFLIILSFEDLKTKMISDKFILCILVVSVVFRIISFGIVETLNGIMTATFIVLVILLIRKVFKQNIGIGDLKLLAVLSLSYGYAGMINVLFYSVIIAMLYSIVMIVLKKKNKHSEIAFVPFISVGCFLTILGV